MIRLRIAADGKFPGSRPRREIQWEIYSDAVPLVVLASGTETMTDFVAGRDLDTPGATTAVRGLLQSRLDEYRAANGIIEPI